MCANRCKINRMKKIMVPLMTAPFPPPFPLPLTAGHRINYRGGGGGGGTKKSKHKTHHSGRLLNQLLKCSTWLLLTELVKALNGQCNEIFDSQLKVYQRSIFRRRQWYRWSTVNIIYSTNHIITRIHTELLHLCDILRCKLSYIQIL